MFERVYNKCLHPTIVKNRYTDEYVEVACGYCPYCLIKKADKATSKCNFKMSNVKYTFFITLTYNSQYVPKMSVTPISDYVPDMPKGITPSLMNQVKSLVYCHPSLDCSQSDIWRNPNNKAIIQSVIDKVMALAPQTFDNIVYTEKPYIVRTIPRRSRLHEFKDEYEEFLYWGDPQLVQKFIQKNKTEGNDNAFPQFKGLIKYINYRDYQLYAKRLRKYLFKKIGSYEKIFTYIVSEYTPRTFRPHFHIILCTDSDEVSCNIREAVYQSWRLGRVDIKLATSGASNYLAGYVNSTTKLPYIYKISKRFIPKGRFSKNYLSAEIEEIQRKAPDELLRARSNGIDFSYNGKYSKYYPSGSDVFGIYPKFGRLGSEFLSENEQVTRSIRQIIRDFRRCELEKETPRNVSRFICRRVEELRKNGLTIDTLPWCYRFYLNYTHNGHESIFYIGDKRLIDSLCRPLYVYNVIQKSNYSLREVELFYSRLDYFRLCQQLSTQEELFHVEPFREELFKSFYVYFGKQRLKDPKVSAHDDENYKEVNYFRVKHKVLNDQNDIFCHD